MSLKNINQRRAKYKIFWCYNEWPLNDNLCKSHKQHFLKVLTEFNSNPVNWLLNLKSTSALAVVTDTILKKHTKRSKQNGQIHQQECHVLQVVKYKFRSVIWMAISYWRLNNACGGTQYMYLVFILSTSTKQMSFFAEVWEDKKVSGMVVDCLLSCGVRQNRLRHVPVLQSAMKWHQCLSQCLWTACKHQVLLHMSWSFHGNKTE